MILRRSALAPAAALLAAAWPLASCRKGDSNPQSATPVVAPYEIAVDERHPGSGSDGGSATPSSEDLARVVKADHEWREQLTDLQYRVTRLGQTEPARTGDYFNKSDPGEYHCVGCGAALFSSEDKYDAGFGWPTFSRPIDETRVLSRPDDSAFNSRVRIFCRACDAHLGHVFEDGPPPTGLRFTVNGSSLQFVPAGPRDQAVDPAP